MTAAPAVLDTYRCLRRNVLRTNWKGTRPKSEAAETADPAGAGPPSTSLALTPPSVLNLSERRR